MAEKLLKAIESCQFGYPAPKFPFYYVTILVKLERTDLRVDRVIVNGDETRDVRVFNGEQESFDRIVEQGARSRIVARVDWENERSYTLEISGESPSTGKGFELERIVGQAPPHGGYWDTAWKHYAGAVLSETAGIPRNKEPVHLTVSFYADRIASPKEVRVVGIDPETGTAIETSCQTYGFDTWNVSKLVKEEPLRYQPTVTLDLVFLADVPACDRKVYLVFYGNPKASEPRYESDLRIRGNASQLEIENAYYSMKLHDKSGLIDEINIKQGVNCTLDHHFEAPGTVHWNPDCYSPPRTWSHASDWNPPPFSAGKDGPIFLMRKYWGTLPFDVGQISASVTYLFYAHNPYVIISTIMKVDDAVAVKVLRNGCFVFKRELFDEFVWKNRAGVVSRVKLAGAPPPPNAVVRLEPDPPWLAFLNCERGFGFGGIPLSYVNESFDEGLVRATQPHCHVMVGPWVSWARLLVNTFMTNNPQRLVQVPKGCLYLERSAYLPFRLNAKEDHDYALLDSYQKTLTNPLEVAEVRMDTDKRVPEKWVPPLLSEEFEV